MTLRSDLTLHHTGWPKNGTMGSADGISTSSSRLSRALRRIRRLEEVWQKSENFARNLIEFLAKVSNKRAVVLKWKILVLI